MAHILLFHAKWGIMPYLLLPIWLKGAWILSTCQHMYHPQCQFLWWQGGDVHNVGRHFISAYIDNSIFE